MRIYVLENQEERREGLSYELHSVGLIPHFIRADFFQSDLSVLLQPGYETRAVLLSETNRVKDQIRAMRNAGCVNPVIVLKNNRNARETSELLNIGADDVIVYPIRGNEVLSRTNSVIRRLCGHAADSVVIGELTAYFDGRDPVVSGSRIKLSKREHSVFQHLALNPNRVISKDAIYDAVYGTSLDQPFDKVIDVYICKLRKKFASASECGWQYIETVHGRGYKLSQPETMSEVG